MSMGITVPSVYRRSLRFAVVTQVVAVLLSGFVDDNGSFILIVLGAWVAFWIGAVLLMRCRTNPKGVELVGLRYGPLAISVAVFVVGQYL